MWAKEREIWKKEEARVQAKIKEVKDSTVAYLKMQEE
jgi:hypothetical protein